MAANFVKIGVACPLPGERAAFLGNCSRLGLLNLQEGLDLVLELRVERALMIRAPILLGEIDRRDRHAEDDEHQRKEQLRAEAERRLLVSTHRLGVGPWDVSRLAGASADHIGLLVLEGVIARELIVADHVSAELLGPGDLIRPWQAASKSELLPASRCNRRSSTAARCAMICASVREPLASKRVSSACKLWSVTSPNSQNAPLFMSQC